MNMTAQPGHSFSGQHETVESELTFLASSHLEDRNAEILSRLLGWSGEGRRTLQEIGDSFGVTRERVRQIRECGLSEIGEAIAAGPRLNACLQAVSSLMPAPADSVEAELEARGFIRPGSRIMESLPETIRRVGRGSLFAVEVIGTVRYVGSHTHLALAKKIWRQAEKDVASWGYANTGSLASRCVGSHKTMFSPQQVEDLLRRRETARFLDDDGNLLIEHLPENRIINRILKAFSVAQELSIYELREAVRREPKLGRRAPGAGLLESICRHIGVIEIEAGRARVTSRPDRDSHLSNAERTLAEILEAAGGVLALDDFEKEALARGINRNTFRLYLCWSPIVVRHGRGVYALIGQAVNEAEVETYSQRFKRSRSIRAWERVNGRQVKCIYQPTPSSLLNGVLSIPSETKGEIRGRYRLIGIDGVEMGHVTVKDTCLSGMRKFFSRFEVAEGSMVTLLFDQSTHTAQGIC